MSEVYDGLDRKRSFELEGEGSVRFEADLSIPAGCSGIILMAHGSGSSRLSPRNQFVARLLRERGLGTLLVDLLAPEERHSYPSGFKPPAQVPLMASRIRAATDRLLTLCGVAEPVIGYMGAGTGAAAVFRAAVEYPDHVRAIVTRGGRVELAHEALGMVKVPTLLIVGAKDSEVAGRNWDAMDQLGASEKRLEIIPGAGHLFVEPGALAAVAMLAGSWFVKHLAAKDDVADRSGTWPTKAVVRVER